jgi:uncharacterized membrane protein YhaH (DUF805 family)
MDLQNLLFRFGGRINRAWWILLFWLLPAVLVSVGAGIGVSSFGLPLALAGAAIVMWAFVEMGCLRGTEGQNAYGADPLPSA